jgi:hypothetical protein
MKVTINEKAGTLVIEMPITNPPTPSKSGKTLLVATTNGALKTAATVNGQAVTVNLNAYIPAGKGD